MPSRDLSFTSEPERQLALWRAASDSGDELALATVVRTDGSAYRKPGAKMLISSSGARSGTVSGGCLEAEICKKIWWLTDSGAQLQRYATSFDDDDRPSYGLGCGGSVDVLLERGPRVHQVLEAHRTALESRRAVVIISILESSHPHIPLGTLLTSIAGDSPRENFPHPAFEPALNSVLANRASEVSALTIDGHDISLFAEYLAPPPALLVFGAGDDAKPVVEMSRWMGWHVTVADGRAHLATPQRFPGANAVRVMPSADPLSAFDLSAFDAAVILTHSFDLDRALLKSLLPNKLRYLGILGARHRTKQLLEEVAAAKNLNLADCYRGLHSPVGLNLGASNPEGIALSIVSEIHAALHSDAAAPSRENQNTPRLSPNLHRSALHV